MPHYTNFEELIQDILLLHRLKPDWKRLDGNKTGGNRSVFATFQYNLKTWKIHSDTRIDKLLDAWKIAEAGEKPFQISETGKGSSCLRLGESNRDKADGLYIYLKE